MNTSEPDYDGPPRCPFCGDTESMYSICCWRARRKAELDRLRELQVEIERKKRAVKIEAELQSRTQFLMRSGLLNETEARFLSRGNWEEDFYQDEEN